jgi:toxin ParE1/3/4
MAYLVELTRRAERDLTDLFERISASDSAAAAGWFNGLEQAIYTLERFPRRCPLAPEGKSAERRRLRHLLYGSRRDVYRVIFEIEERRKRVRVLTIRHGVMERFSRT